MRISYREHGVIAIDGDEQLLSEIAGQSLEGVDISGYRVNADELSKAFNKAEFRHIEMIEIDGKPVEVNNIKVYAALKAKFLETFGAGE